MCQPCDVYEQIYPGSWNNHYKNLRKTWSSYSKCNCYKKKPPYRYCGENKYEIPSQKLNGIFGFAWSDNQSNGPVNYHMEYLNSQKNVQKKLGKIMYGIKNGLPLPSICEEYVESSMEPICRYCAKQLKIPNNQCVTYETCDQLEPCCCPSEISSTRDSSTQPEIIEIEKPTIQDIVKTNEQEIDCSAINLQIEEVTPKIKNCHKHYHPALQYRKNCDCSHAPEISDVRSMENERTFKVTKRNKNDCVLKKYYAIFKPKQKNVRILALSVLILFIILVWYYNKLLTGSGKPRKRFRFC